MADTVKTVGYSLYENYLRSEEDVISFYARVHARGRITQKDLIDMIVKRNTTVTKQEVAAVLEHLEEVVMDNLQMGFRVQTGLFTISVGVRGSFDAMEDEFDPERHKTVINVRTSPGLKKLARAGLAVEKMGPTLPQPSLFSIFDYDSKTTNFQVTPGNVASLTGNNFQIDPEDENQGIYFLSDANPEGAKVENIVHSTKTKLVFTIPSSLTSGNYKVQVRCGFGEALRDSTMKALVTVGEEVNA